MPDRYEAVEQFLAIQYFNYNFVFHVMDQGDDIVSYSKGTYKDQELCIFDIFRIENEKIVEHWDNMEPIPLREE